MEPLVQYANLSEEARTIQNSRLRQQECRSWKMECSKRKLLRFYFLLFVICVICGGISISYSNSVQMQEFPPYSDIAECKLEGYHNNTSWGKNCTVTYTIDFDFPTPIYFYYKLTNFYQNHRSYVPSRTDAQLSGKDASDVADCSPMQKYKGAKLLPCGLIANSFFNDKFNITHIGKIHTQLCPFNVSSCIGNENKANWSDASWYHDGTWEKNDVAWSSDKNSRFRSTKLKPGLKNIGELQEWQKVTLPYTNDVDLMVWMRTAASSTFTKLHRINRNLSFKKGDHLVVRIKNYFDVSAFHGSKSLVISTANSLGGQSQSLGLLFFIMASLSAAAIGIVHVFIPNPRTETEEEKDLQPLITTKRDSF